MKSKKQLTRQMANYFGFKMSDCVTYYFPEIHGSAAEYLIMNETCFPHDIDEALEQLYFIYRSEQ